MTAPKQEKWIYRNKEKLNVKFIGAVGGVFDFFSGNIRRNEYPWFLEHGLEWLPRLIQEPRPLWKRNRGRSCGACIRIRIKSCFECCVLSYQEDRKVGRCKLIYPCLKCRYQIKVPEDCIAQFKPGGREYHLDAQSYLHCPKCGEAIEIK